MIEALFNQPNYVAAKKLLGATELQQEAIASNLGAIELPGYKRVQVNPAFLQQLQEAVRTQDNNQIQSVTPQIEEDPDAVSSRLDGNNVVMEKEVLHLMQTNVEHALETQLVTGNLLRLRLAITGHA
ncbi:MAG TPA: flagellar basal body rod protein FlgB [Verrucomicrobiales bacterium]|nr:flagellar basal body rod protein FlgB [Verrucomicrobiales bacterium]